jgi:uncharacterized membrane protein (UPF0127 family)
MEFQVQLPETLEKGLAGKTKVDKPMLFVFPEVKLHSMWMKGMKIPIDIIFISEDGIIKKVYENVKPIMGPKYSSIVPVKYALECAANDARRLGLVEGEHIRIFRHQANVD